MEVTQMINSVANILIQTCDTLEDMNERATSDNLSLYKSVVSSVIETLALCSSVLEQSSQSFKFLKEQNARINSQKDIEKNLKNELYAYLCETSGMNDFQVWLKEYRTREK